MTRSCARRSFAAETIFMALVICSVFLTERMRRRRSMRLGILLGLCSRQCRLSGLLHPAFDFVDGSGQIRLQCVVNGFLFADVVKNSRTGIFEKPVELGFKRTAFL